MQAVCSQFASGSGAGDHHFAALYKKLNKDRALFQWPFVFTQEEDNELELDSAELESAEPAAVAAASAADDVVVAALLAEAAALRETAEGQRNDLGRDVFIGGHQVEGREQDGANLSLGLGSSPLARSEGPAINTPLPGKA